LVCNFGKDYIGGENSLANVGRVSEYIELVPMFFQTFGGGVGGFLLTGTDSTFETQTY